MSRGAPFLTSIERFAALAAALDDPFADRASVLHSAGLDAAGWERVVAHWSRRISSEGGEPLATSFGAAYAAAKPPARAPERTPAVAGAAGFLSTEAQPWRAEAALVAAPSAASPASTLDVDMRVLVASLPFSAASPNSAPMPLVTESAPRREDVGGTLPLGSHLQTPVLPFKPNG